MNNKIEEKLCNIYTNKFGTCFVDCKSFNRRYIYSFPLPDDSEDVKYCMFCGNQLIETNKNYKEIKVF